MRVIDATKKLEAEAEAKKQQPAKLPKPNDGEKEIKKQGED